MISTISGIKPYETKSFNGAADKVPRKANSYSLGNEELDSLREHAKTKKSIEDQALELKKKQDEEQFTQKDLNDYTDTINDTLKEENLAIEFSKDKDTNKMILKLIDKETQEVVQQYPPEIALKIARIVANTLERGSLTNVQI